MNVDDLKIINLAGNASDPYEPDRPFQDDWRPEASLTGKDCDSFASWKKRQILKIRWKMNEVMALATCWTTPHKADEDYHCVLLVYLEGEVWVLDNAGLFCTYIEAERRGYVFDNVPEYMQEFIET